MGEREASENWLACRRDVRKVFTSFSVVEREKAKESHTSSFRRCYRFAAFGIMKSVFKIAFTHYQRHFRVAHFNRVSHPRSD